MQFFSGLRKLQLKNKVKDFGRVLVSDFSLTIATGKAKKPDQNCMAQTLQPVKSRGNPSRSFSLEFSESLDFLCILSFIKERKYVGYRGKAPIKTLILSMNSKCDKAWT